MRFKFLRNKAAQITVFMIIGVVLLFSSALVLYIRGQVQEQVITAVGPQAVEQLPLDLKPLQDYVQNCIEQVGSQGTTQLMQMGGNLYPASSLVDDIEEPLNGDMMSIVNGKLSIPYWYYEKNGGQQGIIIPPLRKNASRDNSIEGQLGRYVDENIEACLGDFSALKALMDISPGGKPLTNAIVTKDSVSFTLDYPLKVVKGGNQRLVSKFQDQVYVNLESIYSLALAFTFYEIGTSFLETTTIGMFHKYSRKDPNFLPPVSGPVASEVCGNSIKWDVTASKEKAQQVISSTIPYLRINNTNFVRRIIPGDDWTQRTRQKVYDGFIMDIGIKPQPNLRVSFQPFGLKDFQINGKTSGTVTPRSLLTLPLVALDLCMKDYSFDYTIKYPILVRIEDSTPNRESFFQFPLQVVVKANYPRIYQGQNVSVASSLGNAPANASLSCSDDQFNNDIHVKVVDNFTGMPIPAVNIKLQCGISSDKCPLGSAGDTGVFDGKAPKCIGGVMIFEKKGYLKQIEVVDTLENSNISTSLIPLVDVPFDLKKVSLGYYDFDKYKKEIETAEDSDIVPDNYNPCKKIKDEDKSANMKRFCSILGEEGSDSWLDYTYEDEEGNTIINASAILPLCSKGDESVSGLKDSASITYTKQNLLTGILDQQSAVNFRKEDNNTIPLAPGIYDFEVILTRSGKIVFPAKSEKMGSGDNVFYMPDTEQTVTNPIVGGVIANNIAITKEDIMSGKKLTFYSYDMGEPKGISDSGKASTAYPICTQQLGQSATKPKWG